MPLIYYLQFLNLILLAFISLIFINIDGTPLYDSLLLIVSTLMSALVYKLLQTSGAILQAFKGRLGSI